MGMVKKKGPICPSFVHYFVGFIFFFMLYISGVFY